MTFNVTMPDGTVIENIPDGTSKADVLAMHNKSNVSFSDIPDVEKPGQLGTAINGLAQGLSAGFSDEIDATMRTAGASLLNQLPFRDDIRTSYAKNLDKVRGFIDSGEKEYPNTSLVSDVVGSLAGGVGAIKALGKLAPKTFLGDVGYSAAEGAGHGYGRSDTNDEAVGDVLTGAALGGIGGGVGHAGGELVGRLLRGKGFRPDTVRNVQADDLGIQLSPAQKFDDRALHKVEASMRSDTGYSKAFEEMDFSNQVRANQIASKAMGKQSSSLTELEMGGIAKNIANKFKRAANNGDMVAIDTKWLDDLDLIESGYRKIPGKSDASVGVLNDLRDIASKNQAISPEDYQFYYSGFGKDLEKASKAGDGHKVDLFRKLRSSLDDMADRSSKGMSKEFNDARQLYKAKRLIQKPGVLNSASGDVSPLTLGNKLRQDTRGYVEGGNTTDLYNLARVAQSKKSGIGDSGTATRSKTLLDYMLSPIKEPLGNLYLSGKYGTALMGGTSGLGAKSGLPIAAFLSSVIDNKKQK